MPPRALWPRRLAALLGCLALAGVFGWPRARERLRAPAPPPATRLRLLTWNVGKVFFRWDSRAADRDLAHVAGVLRAVAPDVAALQEMRDRPQLARLLAALGPGWEGAMPAADEYDRRVAILVRGRHSTAFPSLLTSTGRAVIAASVPLGGRRATVVSLHLDAFNRTRRRLQAEEVLGWLDRLGGEAFLAGDFNFDADFLAANDPGHPDLRLYRRIARRFRDLSAGAGATAVLARRVDYVFGAATRLHVRGTRVVGGQRINLMDHDPLLVDAEVAPAGRRPPEIQAELR